MKILYIAKHDSGGGDDEGAISFALESLGHKVLRTQENDSKMIRALDATQGVDFCLFHKWYDLECMKRVTCPKIFWFFDLVDWSQDPTLSSRCEARKRWMADVVPLVDLGFCTDGDWVDRWNMGSYELGKPGKLVTLRQGADERVVGFGKAAEKTIDVLFVGIGKGGGVERESFVSSLQERYGERFKHVSKGVYGRQLADLVATAKVVVCPDSPVTDRYWSNRVYVLGGFGACLLHPRCHWLWNNYSSCVSGVSHYSNRGYLYEQIDYLLNTGEESKLVRDRMGWETLQDIKHHHLYRHRCEELIRVVKERLNVS